MKQLALAIIISAVGVALSAEEYTIQTISAQKEASITPAFEKKVHSSTLESSKKKEGSCNIVTVGHYETIQKARADLSKAKKIAKDAFVRPIERKTPKACLNDTVATKGDKVSKSVNPVTATVTAAKAEVKGVKGKEETIEPIKGVATAEKMNELVKPLESKEMVPAVSKAADVVVATQPAVTASPSVSAKEESATPSVYLYDRNLARKSDIHEAIEYYRNSPYYTFKPVAMQQR